jgi:hypothetical protein
MSMPFEPIMPQHFSAGFDAGREPTLSPGLEAQSERWNTLVQKARVRGTGEASQEPNSVLQARALSPNGMAASLAENRMLNGAFMPAGTSNGMSQGTLEQYNQTRMIGGVA